MGIKKLPTRTDDSLGRIKEDKKPAVDKTTQLSASEYNALADAVVEIAETIGLEDGSTPGSIEARLAALEAGGGSGGSGWTAGLYMIEYEGTAEVWKLHLRDHVGELPLPEELLPETGWDGDVRCWGIVSVPPDTPEGFRMAQVNPTTALNFPMMIESVFCEVAEGYGMEPGEKHLCLKIQCVDGQEPPESFVVFVKNDAFSLALPPPQ